MEIGNLSPSKLKGFRLCEARATAKMTDDYEEDRGEAAAVGILAHEAAKHWYRPVGQTWTPEGHVDQVSYAYDKPEDAFTAAIHSCANKKNDRTGEVENEMPREPGGVIEAREMFDQIVSFYDRSKMKVLFAERRYKGRLANGVPVHLIIDLAVDVGGGMLDICDYKTGFLSMTTEEMWDEDQVLMNLLALGRDPAFIHYRTKQFKYFWVRKGFETGPVFLPPERLNDYEQALALEYQRITSITEPKESLNRFCATCGRRFECNKYAEFLGEAFGLSAPMTPEGVQGMGLDKVLAQYERIGAQQKKLEELQKGLGEIIKAEFQKQKQVEVAAGGLRAVLRSNKREEYDSKTVWELCQQYHINPIPLLSFGKKDVQQAFGSYPEAMQILTSKMFRGQTAPFIQVSPVKEKKGKK